MTKSKQICHMRIYRRAHIVAMPPNLWKAAGSPSNFEVSLDSQSGSIVYKPLFLDGEESKKEHPKEGE